MPILFRLSERYGKRISLSFVGVHPDLDPADYNFNIRFYKSMPLLEYRDFMKRHNFDIGLAVLQENDFNRCKYFNKYIEYSIVGVTGIYSKCEPYTFAIKNGHNGFLAENNPDHWYEAICNAIDDDELRRNCYKNALDDLKIITMTKQLKTGSWRMFRKF